MGSQLKVIGIYDDIQAAVQWNWLVRLHSKTKLADQDQSELLTFRNNEVSNKTFEVLQYKVCYYVSCMQLARGSYEI